MLPPPAERPKLAAVLAQLGGAVEEFLLSGLTTASDATKQTLAAAMQEAARFRMLRLSSTLRTANEELGRFTAHDTSFSRKRLLFFLSRAWLLSRGLTHALKTANEQEYDRLTWSPPTQPLSKVDAVCLGVVKRVAAGAFVAFEFRFRAVADDPPVVAGQSLAWSCVFPIKLGVDVPPEGFLHLPQKQKFTPFVLLDQKIVRIEWASISPEEPCARLTLTDQSTVTPGEAFTEWTRFLDWQPDNAAERIRKHRPGPLDLDAELQEEIVLTKYEVGPATDGDTPGQTVFPVSTDSLTFSAIASAHADGKALREHLEALRKLKKDRPPLYGLMHYERCRLIFQPLTAFHPEPDYLTISKANINKAALLKAMSFT